MCVFSCYDLPNAARRRLRRRQQQAEDAGLPRPGATQAAFACEQVIDELAEKLKIDPIEFRLKNAAKEGTRRVDGPVYPRIGLIETLEAAKNSDALEVASSTGKNRGRGIASGFWFNIGGASSCSASVNDDGTVTLLEGSTDIGGTRTSIAMQLAETLGITAEDVRPQVGRHRSRRLHVVTGGSRVTFATGLAAYKLGLDLQSSR